MGEKAIDEKTLIINRTIGVALIFAGIYGLYMAFKIQKSI